MLTQMMNQPQEPGHTFHCTIPETFLFFYIVYSEPCGDHIFKRIGFEFGCLFLCVFSVKNMDEFLIKNCFVRAKYVHCPVRCRQNILATINIFFLLSLLRYSYFSPQQICMRPSVTERTSRKIYLGLNISAWMRTWNTLYESKWSFVFLEIVF